MAWCGAGDDLPRKMLTARMQELQSELNCRLGQYSNPPIHVKIFPGKDIELQRSSVMLVRYARMRRTSAGMMRKTRAGMRTACMLMRLMWLLPRSPPQRQLRRPQQREPRKCQEWARGGRCASLPCTEYRLRQGGQGRRVQGIAVAGRQQSLHKADAPGQASTSLVRGMPLLRPAWLRAIFIPDLCSTLQ